MGIASLGSLNINATEYNINCTRTKEICIDEHYKTVIQRDCNYRPYQCGTAWPFGMDRTVIDYYQPICQLYEKDGGVWKPVGPSYKGTIWWIADGPWFVGCGCTPDGDPPYITSMPTLQVMPKTIK